MNDDGNVLHKFMVAGRDVLVVAHERKIRESAVLHLVNFEFDPAVLCFDRVISGIIQCLSFKSASGKIREISVIRAVFFLSEDSGVCYCHDSCLLV